MYAINHAATALLLKKQFPSASMLLLLISVQLVELLWVVLNYFNVEHFLVANGKLSLDFLPWSHSVLSSIILAGVSFAVINGVFKNRALAIAFSIGVLSHILLDVFFHEEDIQLSPFASHPSWGLGIINYPVINFLIELCYGIFCWWYFKGSRNLLLVIVLFNFMNLPVMLASGDSISILGEIRFILPSFILFQIIITWYVIWRYGNKEIITLDNISPQKN
jgi:hypothetical protein